jgi:hypothetical protein
MELARYSAGSSVLRMTAIASPQPVAALQRAPRDQVESHPLQLIKQCTNGWHQTGGFSFNQHSQRPNNLQSKLPSQKARLTIIQPYLATRVS